ncbi:hypothetical protein FDP41_011273 [Naegleria fowleri]|uniref:Uncharacterized protein n=1 Tax=Naegleria fowleri TaxID=5763 RepID=A0A6A5BW87_NAEFO|nr:uncharacterized protein FDP41_011273 [Naegleria fowleri]KAF0982343.1 hypothetical protein FDP41_011273 [Naegleria fowleri]
MSTFTHSQRNSQQHDGKEHINELHQWYHQYVLLDESLQGIFKKNISEQIQSLKKQNVRHHQPYRSGEDVNHHHLHRVHGSRRKLSNHGVQHSHDDCWNPISSSSSSWYEHSCDDKESIPFPIISDTQEEEQLLNNNHNGGYKYLLELNYDGLKVGKYISTQQPHHHLAKYRTPQSFKHKKPIQVRLSFTKEIIPTVNSWCQIKVPGCCHIGMFNFYMKNYLIKYKNNDGVENKDSSSSSDAITKDMHGYEYCEKLPNITNTQQESYQIVCQLYPSHIPLKHIRLSEGCSYRHMQLESVQECREKSEYLSMMKKIELRNDMDQCRFAKYKDEHANEMEAEFSRDPWSLGGGRMILELAMEAIPDDLYEYLCECEEKYQNDLYGVYLNGEDVQVYSGSMKTYEWRGSIVMYTESYLESIGSFEMRMLN